MKIKNIYSLSIFVIFLSCINALALPIPCPDLITDGIPGSISAEYESPNGCYISSGLNINSTVGTYEFTENCYLNDGGLFEYEQCGGTDWIGSTQCMAGLACVYMGAYDGDMTYYQCQRADMDTLEGASCDNDNGCAGRLGCINNICAIPEAACVPDCSGKTCGDDGCGGSCGTCTSGKYCSTENTCVSISGGGGSDNCALYMMQCGGIGYTGPTNCCTGYTCTYMNDYYSQCI